MSVDTLENLVHTPLAKALGWTLFHSLWQGAAVAILLLCVLAIARSARARYAAACLAMLAIALGSAFTFTRVMPQKRGLGTSVIRTIPGAPVAAETRFARDLTRTDPADVVPWLTPFWIAGVIVFQLRALASWTSARRLRTRGTCLAPDEWQIALARLQAKLRLSKTVALLESAVAEVPVVIGWLRPVILVPIGMFAGMSPGQVEALLMHELAHVRRHDYLVNLLQTAVEGFLFYHPAVWWISSVIRTERENCCDDLVVATNGNAPDYAAALTSLEETRHRANEAVVASTGGSLMKRIRRLLYPRESPRAVLAPAVSAGILTVTAAFALVAWQAPQTQPAALNSASGQLKPLRADKETAKLVTQSPERRNPSPTLLAAIPSVAAALPIMSWQTSQAPRNELETPWKKWLNEDVVYIITDEERKAFKALQTDEERAQFVEQFWGRRNPTPGSPDNAFKTEQYRRIAYANAHFGSKSSIPGWKNDRGRIYIMFGPPDEIDSHPTPASQNEFPFEDWRYRWIEGIGANVVIEFVDSGNNGEYHMTMDPNGPGRGAQYVPRPQ